MCKKFAHYGRPTGMQEDVNLQTAKLQLTQTSETVSRQRKVITVKRSKRKCKKETITETP